MSDEPKGPTLPPKKSAEVQNLEIIKVPVKHLKTKGIIAAITAAIVLVMYLIYSYYYYEKNIELDDLYFAVVGSGTAIFTGLLFTFFSNRIVKTVLLFAFIFHTILEMIFISMWVLFQTPYAYIKFSLFIGLGAGILYFIYDYIKNDS